MTDSFPERAVVLFLGVATLLGMAGLIYLVGQTNVKDAALLAIVAGPTGTALGALGSLLARAGGSQPVVVTNAPEDPVPTEEAKAKASR